MAVEGRDGPIPKLMESSEAKGRIRPGVVVYPAAARAEEEEESDFVEGLGLTGNIRALRENWRLITAAVLIAMTATWFLTAFAMVKWYRAEAILRPAEQGGVQSRMLGALGASMGAANILRGVEVQGSADAYVPILQSYAFTHELAQRHGLAPPLLARYRPWFWHLWGETEDPQWVVYEIMRRRFECEYSVRSGNLTLYYRDPNRLEAERTLGFYIEDLRDHVREEQIRDANKAAQSLRDEMKASSDVMLETDLAELAARQIERAKLAETEASYAFTVLQPPTAPREAYQPMVLFDGVLAGLLAAVVAAGWALIRARGHYPGFAQRGEPSEMQPGKQSKGITTA
ncbi:MAG: hypothetical protein WA005_02365 [Candidatus Binataceae bacterium]